MQVCAFAAGEDISRERQDGRQWTRIWGSQSKYERGELLLLMKTYRPYAFFYTYYCTVLSYYCIVLYLFIVAAVIYAAPINLGAWGALW